MGNKILVSVFDTEPTAFEGLAGLKDLHREGDITVYATSVIVKDRSGAVAVRQTAEKGPLGTLLGAVTGGLVGLIGGPAGAAVGAYLGGFGGLTYDLFRAGVGIDFVDEVGTLLTPGKAALIADVDETWVTPVDTRLGALGGTTFRRLPGEVIDAQLIRESAATELELAELQAELRESSHETKAKLKASVDAQKRKLQATSDRIQKDITNADAEFEARLATLREQQGKAHERQRARIDARIEELTASHDVRKAKLEDARRLAEQSVDATREALVS
jgi:uncharacterized membrane protein